VTSLVLVDISRVAVAREVLCKWVQITGRLCGGFKSHMESYGLM
jgi:hypothetical protein